MSTTSRVFLIICVLLFFVIILRMLVKRRLNLKYTLTWLLSVVIMLVVLVFPSLLDAVTDALGIALPVNAVMVFAGMFGIAIILSLTMIVSHLNNRVYRLSQTQALLERRIRELEAAQSNEAAAGRGNETGCP